MKTQRIGFPTLASFLEDSGKFSNYSIPKVNFKNAELNDRTRPINGSSITRVQLLQSLADTYPAFLCFLNRKLRKRDDYQDDETFTPWIACSMMDSIIDVLAYRLHRKRALKEQTAATQENLKHLRKAKASLDNISSYKNLFLDSKTENEMCRDLISKADEIECVLQRIATDLDRTKNIDQEIDQCMQLAFSNLSFLGGSKNKFLNAVLKDLKAQKIRIYQSGFTQRASEAFDEQAW